MNTAYTQFNFFPFSCSDLISKLHAQILSLIPITCLTNYKKVFSYAKYTEVLHHLCKKIQQSYATNAPEKEEVYFDSQ